MASKFIKYDLNQLTDYLGFESLCHDLMSREGYKAIQPLGGTGDKGRDAIHFDRSTSVATIFAYSVRKDWEDKLDQDLAKIPRHQHDCDQFIFICTSPISAATFDTKKAEVKEKYGFELELYDLERLATLIENHHQDLINNHSNIFNITYRVQKIPEGSDAFNPHQYAAYLLGSHDLWANQYTPLLAEHKEIDTFVDVYGEDDNSDKLPVATIPEKGSIAFLLGESGAGKTTSLWEIVVQFARQLIEGNQASLPVMINLRAWSTDKRCRQLLQEQFKLFDASDDTIEGMLREGQLLILFDGLNEVLQSNETHCYFDIAQFISNYRNNHFIVACRSADFGGDLIPISEMKPELPSPSVYEICRLDRQQIIDYANAYFHRHALTSMDAFFEQLNIHDDDSWDDETASVQLARIPLYLQIFLDVFKQTGELPHGRAMLLKALVNKIYSREKGRGNINLDQLASERMLSSLSFQSVESDYYLRFPEQYAQQKLLDVFELLRTCGMIAATTVFGDAWRDILSANFLKTVTDNSIEWLHQLIRDYFLGIEYARIWQTDDEQQLEALQHRLRGKIRHWDTPSTIALSLLDPKSAASFLLFLIDAGEEKAKHAFENQTVSTRLAIANHLVCSVLDKGDPESHELRIATWSLPYPEIAEALGSNFYYSADLEMQAMLIEAIGEMVIEHLPSIDDETFALYWHSRRDIARYQQAKAAMKRCAELLNKYLRNSNELASFNAAKGLWEHDRQAAMDQLKKLLQSSDAGVVEKVKDLLDEWGVEQLEH